MYNTFYDICILHLIYDNYSDVEENTDVVVVGGGQLLIESLAVSFHTEKPVLPVINSLF